MGTLKIQMGGYLREKILGNTSIFDPVTEETLKSAPTGDPVKLKTGDLESRIEVRHHEKGLEATFIYPLDSDPKGENGRLYAEDRFLYDPEKKELVTVARTFRMGSGAAGHAEWGKLFGRLKELEDQKPLETEDPRVKQFFSEVVLALPAPVTGEDTLPYVGSASSASASSEFLSHASLSGMAAYSGSEISALYAYCLEQGAASLWRANRSGKQGAPGVNLVHRHRVGVYKLSELCHAVDQVVGRASEGLSDPIVLGSLLAGTSAFHAGEAVMLNRLAGLRQSSPRLAQFLGAASGLTLEAPTFELTNRKLQSVQQENPNLWRWNGREGLGQGLERSYLTFGTFRGAQGLSKSLLAPLMDSGFLPFGSSTGPVFSGAAAFATLHGVNEAERKFNLREEEGPWAIRLAADGGFFAQMLLAGGLVGMVSGPKTPSLVDFRPPKRVGPPPMPITPPNPGDPLPHFPEVPLSLPAPGVAAPAPEPPAAATVTARKSNPPPSRPPPKSLPPVVVGDSVPRFATEIEGLNTDFENHFRQGMQVVPDPATGEYSVRFKGGANQFTVKDERIYRAFLLWRERALFAEGGLPKLAHDFATYEVKNGAHTLLDHPVLLPAEAVRNGQKSYYLGPLIEVADSPQVQRYYVFSLITEYEGGQMHLKKGFFYRAEDGTWKSPVEGYEDMHLREAENRVITVEMSPPPPVLEYLQGLDRQSTVQLPMNHEQVMQLIQ